MTQGQLEYGSYEHSAGRAGALCDGRIRGVSGPSVRERVRQSEKDIADIVAEGRVVYGVNTGFGPLCTTINSAEDTRKLQYNILRSHSVGVGDPVPVPIAKLMLIIKAHALCQGYS